MRPPDVPTSSLALRGPMHRPSILLSAGLQDLAESTGPYYRPDITLDISSARTRRSRGSSGTPRLEAGDLLSLIDLAAFDTDAPSRRPYPAAGALYATHLYFCVCKVNGIPSGIYYLRWVDRRLERIGNEDEADGFIEQAVDQEDKDSIQCLILVLIRTEISSAKYSDRAIRFAMLEAGALMQTCYLAGESLGIRVCALGTISERLAMELCRAQAEESTRLGVALSVAGT
jgi:SagB-type dehydrogenase family enzyme